MRAYVLSPGASIWATSPLLLLAFPGAIMLWRAGRARTVMALALLIAGYTAGHAMLTGAHWFGGLSWPPRFLLPCIPILMLATAPVARAMLQRRQRRLRLVWAALLVYGVWIQFTGASLSLSRYSESLPPEAHGLSEWQASLTQPRYFRWVVLPQRWLDLGFEFLWGARATADMVIEFRWLPCAGGRSSVSESARSRGPLATSFALAGRAQPSAHLA